jgi:hypothetical protein
MVNLKPCLSFSNMHVYVYLNYLLYVLFVQQLIASLLFLQISNKMFIKLHLTIKNVAILWLPLAYLPCFLISQLKSLNNL